MTEINKGAGVLFKKLDTPGPWVVCINSLDQRISIEQDARAHQEPTIVVDCVADMGSGLSREIGLANARLIAAAPALLKALEELVKVVDLHEDSVIYDLQIAEARAAITEATECSEETQ